MKRVERHSTLVVWLLIASCELSLRGGDDRDAGAPYVIGRDAEVSTRDAESRDSGHASADASVHEPDSGALSWPDASDQDAGPIECVVDASTPAPSTEEYCAQCGAREQNLCCVAGGACCVSQLELRAQLSFATCLDGNQACELPGVGFGPGPITYLDHSFIPAVSSAERSGFVLERAIAADERFGLVATVRIGDHADCTECADFVGIGVAADVLTGVALPDFSVTASSVLGQLIVATGAKSLWTMPVTPGDHEVELRRDPTGAAELWVDGSERASFRVTLPGGSLWPLMFGRTDERLTLEARARVKSVLVETSRCETTSAWGEHAPLWADSPGLGDRRAPSVVTIANERWVAYESAGVIRTARVTNPKEMEDSPLTLEPTAEGFETRALSDPEWVMERGGLSLYYTAVDLDGLRSVARASLGAGTPFTVGQRAQLLAPALLGARELFAPSVTRDPSGGLWLLCTAMDNDGTSRLVLLAAKEEGDAGPNFDLSTASTVLAASKGSDASGFTALGSAEIIYRRGQYQIYFAGSRMGTWAVGLLLSSDAKEFWKAGSVLTGTSGSGFDESGVLDPDIIEDGGSLRLFYTAYTVDTQSKSILSHWQIASVSRSADAVCAGRDCGKHSDCAPPSMGGQCVCALGFVPDDEQGCVASPVAH